MRLKYLPVQTRKLNRAISQPVGGITTHSTGAAIARLSSVKLKACLVDCSPVNSGVMPQISSQRVDEKPQTKECDGGKCAKVKL
jgi:hypothetical protein